MHLKSKLIAILGLLTALSVLCIILSAVIEPNTLLLLGLASLNIGVAIREGGVKYGACFLVASTLLGFILASDKIVVLTYLAMDSYILCSEICLRWFQKTFKKGRREFILVIKLLIFNVMYVPALIFMPTLFYNGTISWKLWILLWIAGQVALYIYDLVYHRCMIYYEESIRKRIGL